MDSSAVRPKYWVYFLDAEDNFLDAEVVEAADDSDALLHLEILHARTRGEGYIIELWDRDRMVGRVGPAP